MRRERCTRKDPGAKGEPRSGGCVAGHRLFISATSIFTRFSTGVDTSSTYVLIPPAEVALWKRGASNAGYHYLGCARTFALMGKNFAEANLVMMKLKQQK